MLTPEAREYLEFKRELYQRKIDLNELGFQPEYQPRRLETTSVTEADKNIRRIIRH